MLTFFLIIKQNFWCLSEPKVVTIIAVTIGDWSYLRPSVFVIESVKGASFRLVYT